MNSDSLDNLLELVSTLDLNQSQDPMFMDPFITDTPEEAQDRQVIQKNMNSEGIYHNQLHYQQEMERRMARMKQKRQDQAREDAKAAEQTIKVSIYRVLLDKQCELLETPTSQVDFQRYLKLVDALQALKNMHLDNWWGVDQQDLLNQLLAPLEIRMHHRFRRCCCPVSLDE